MTKQLWAKSILLSISSSLRLAFLFETIIPTVIFVSSQTSEQKSSEKLLNLLLPILGYKSFSSARYTFHHQCTTLETCSQFVVRFSGSFCTFSQDVNFLLPLKSSRKKTKTCLACKDLRSICHPVWCSRVWNGYEPGSAPTEASGFWSLGMAQTPSLLACVSTTFRTGMNADVSLKLLLLTMWVWMLRPSV